MLEIGYYVLGSIGIVTLITPCHFYNIMKMIQLKENRFRPFS